MKRFFIAAGVVLALSLGLVGIASADNGPHGGYTATTDACAGCHRAHTGKGASLLTVAGVNSSDKSAFCYTCHDAGTGAYTNVKAGLFDVSAASNIGADVTENTIMTTTVFPTATQDKPLLGGGFETALMNRTWNLTSGPASPESVTSAHTVDGSLGGTNGMVWGFGSVTTTTGTVGATGGAYGISLTCTNCHNPHGKAGLDAGGAVTGTYRILKGQRDNNTSFFVTATITSVTAITTVLDQYPNKTYFLDDPLDLYLKGSGLPNYHGAGGGPLGLRISQFCASCHTRYLTPIGVSSYGRRDQPGVERDANFKYTHTSGRDSRNCMTCHVAHGTSAKMGDYSGAVAYPNGDPGDGDNRSSLLRGDNRAVCRQCHAIP